MRLSVLIPHYNEKATLLALLGKVLQVPLDKEIILVDDASTDGSRELIREKIEGKYPNVKVIYHEKNRGKGAAIRTGLKEAKGEIVLIQDADLEYDPQDFIKISRAFEENGTQVVYGTRFKDLSGALFLRRWLSNVFGGKKYELKRFHHFFGIRFLTVLANLLYSAHITDEATCYKAFKKTLLDKINLRCTGFEFCPEITAKVRKAGVVIKEVPVSYHPRTELEGKKMNWTHGFEAAFALLKYRFVD